MARDWQAEKERFLNMELEDKRKLYHQKNYKTIKDIKTWKEYYAEKKPEPFHYNVKDPRFKGFTKPLLTKALNDKMAEAVSVWQGDITTLEIDAIVNAANTSLRGGGGVDGAIHRAASTLLIEECITLNGCSTGDAKMTAGYTLPAKYVIHTVGPQGEKPKLLNSAYTKSLQIALQNHLKIVAFPSISTGVYGYPMEKATQVALGAVRAFLEKNSNVVNRVIFVVFSDDDLNTYERWMQIYFPVVEASQDAAQ